MKSAVILVILLAAGTAHAMGTDYIDTIEAWNSDGTAALVRVDTSRDGDRSASYVVLTTGAAQVTSFAITATSRYDSKDNEQIAVADCQKAAGDLAHAVAAASFSGVAVRAEACKKDRSGVVVVTAANAKAVEQSWVAWPQLRAPSAREQAALDAMAVAHPGYQAVTTDPNAACRDLSVDVATATGKLVVVVSSSSCGSPTRMTAQAYEPTKSGMVARGET